MLDQLVTDLLEQNNDQTLDWTLHLAAPSTRPRLLKINSGTRYSMNPDTASLFATMWFLADGGVVSVEGRGWEMHCRIEDQ
jgi:hypothetical protein